MGTSLVLLLFVALGYRLYKRKHFFSGATLLLGGYIVLFHFIDKAGKEYLAFTKDFTYMDFYLWEGIAFFLVLVFLYGKAILDSSRSV